MDQVVSLAPSATSTVIGLGAREQLVGITTHDDLEDVPSVGGWLNPDLDQLRNLEPDLVLTADALQGEIAESLAELDCSTFHHEPTTLESVIDGFEAVGTAIGRPNAGQTLANEARDRISRLKAITPDDPLDRPVVYCEEWPDPPMAAGNWVPEAIEAAGGRYPFGNPGDRSAAIEQTTVEEADPSHMVVHHCGFGEQAKRSVSDRWNLNAQVHVIDDSLLNQPSPRLIDGIELLAELFHGVELPSEPMVSA